VLSQTTVPGSDDWWLVQLAEQLGGGFPRLHKLRRYANGDAPLPDDSPRQMRRAYARFVKRSRLNMADLIVSARVNRMKPLGFRTAAPDDDFGDKQAWGTWKRSHMRVGFRDHIRALGIYGAAYVTTVGESTAGAADPLLLPSDGWTTASAQDSLRPWETEYTLVAGYDPIDGVDTLTLFGPGWVRVAQRNAKVTSIPNNGNAWAMGRNWGWTSDRVPLGWTARNPVVKYEAPDGMGLFEKHLDVIDRINGEILNRLTITAMQAFRQRGIEGNLPEFYPPDHPTMAGQRINYDDIYQAGPAALWLLPEGAKVWESQTTDITPILTAIKDDIKQLSAVSSTALYILSPDVADGSAASASLSREALSFNVGELQDRVDESLATSLALAFEAQRDDVRSEVGEISTIWAAIDGSSITERAAAAQQAKAGGMTQNFIDEKIFGYSPEEMEKAATERQTESLLVAAAAGAGNGAGAAK
jgi:hypothetical protein